eukprot:CAMPEP_0197665368 /NCGR_PEP_ID=MMETSP1338-20131121/59180_1 /TAXON_ID=43686 ORGANISM="Pelagodinium beii, Strain RCC1491" /NCGR_SAMPLE_ID=MMETSP1338 /ASSEMBLY_ACC=CAM_ASM_000754 /LENGTH=515 /DNA_ID=CAMNT_0043244155 /DNA_START=36 /DNA_END=1583 /DNA_ORIENTATION=+
MAADSVDSPNLHRSRRRRPPTPPFEQLVEESRFRETARFKQTDGWSPPTEDYDEDILTKPKEPRPWHVPDHKIQALVTELGAREGFDDKLLQHVKCREPRQVDQTEESAEQEELSADMVETVKLEGTRQRSVRFEGPPEEDALDMMMKSTLSYKAPEPEAAEEEEVLRYDEDGRPIKSWKVSDEAIEKYILKARSTMETSEMLSSAPLHHSAPAKAKGLSKSSSAPTLGASLRAVSEGGRSPTRKDDGTVEVKIFFLDSGDTMRVRVSRELRIGPAKPPKGNRFTDMYGLAANTKGFDQVKQFDIQKKRFGSTLTKEWSPAWSKSQSLKGLIEELTGAEVLRQRLMYKNVQMASDDMTIRTWAIKDGDTISVAFRRRLPTETLKTAAEDNFLATGRPRFARTGSTISLADSMPKQSFDQLRIGDVGTTKLRNSKHLKLCKADGDVWMMPRWISQDNPRQFAEPGDPTTTVANQEPPSFADGTIFLPDVNHSNISKVRIAVTGYAAYTNPSDQARR